jgi:hypothetical protein
MQGNGITWDEQFDALRWDYLMSEGEAVTLRDFVTEMFRAADKRYAERFNAQSEALNIALAAAEKAVLKAETAAERRFESVNEFRGSLNDLVNRMLPRGEADQRFTGMEEKHDEMRQRLAAIGNQLRDFTPRDTLDAQIRDLTSRFDSLVSSVSQRDAKAIGIYAGWGYVVGAVSFVIAVVSVMYNILSAGGPH